MNAPKISFDGWLLDRESGDLSRGNARQRLQELPLKLLDLLLENPGSVVTREELIGHLWPKGVVDFDTGINTAVRKLRVALGDVADTPRYIETLPRRGYRFIGTLDSAADLTPPDGHPQPLPPEPPPDSSTVLPLSTAAAPVAGAGRGRRVLVIGAMAATALAAALAYGLLHRTPVPTIATASSGPPSSAPALPGHSVAVLPFENLSAAPNSEFLALGIAEMVLHRLAGLKDLTVIARTSSFEFKNRNEDAREIGRKLNARFLVEGSVQREGERLRVTTELIDANSGGRVWSLSFDRQLVDIFALQDEISAKVAEALSVSLTAGADGGLERRTANLDAYLAYLQGRALASTFKTSDAEAAIGRFAQAIEFDPQFAAAYAQEARAISQLMSLREHTDPAAAARAASLNDKALELDPALGEAWVQRASSRDPADKQESMTAEKEFRKGLALAPNYGEGFAEFAEFLYEADRIEEALTMIERARKVDPLAARNHYLKGLFLWFDGHEAKEVEPLFLQALKINPTFHAALARLGRVRDANGEFAEAAKLLERALAIDPQAQWVREPLTMAYLNMGDMLAATDVLKLAGDAGKGLDLCTQVYQGELRAASGEAYALMSGAEVASLTAPAERCAAVAIREDALATHRYDRALHIFEAQYAVHAGGLADAAWIAAVWGLPYAQVLHAKGDDARATQLNNAVLAALESAVEKLPSRPFSPYWHAVARAQVGDSDQALASLKVAVHGGLRWPWWFIDREGAFAHLSEDARYQAIMAELSAHARKEAMLAAAMRKRHELPDRPSSPIS